MANQRGVRTHIHFVNVCKHGVLVDQCRCLIKKKPPKVVPCPPECEHHGVEDDGAVMSAALTHMQMQRDVLASFVKAILERNGLPTYVFNTANMMGLCSRPERVVTPWVCKAASSHDPRNEDLL